MAPLINFSGIASGIDSSALIKAILDQQRKAQITPLQTRVTELTDTNKSFDELSSLLGKLKTAASAFRAVNGGALSKTASSSSEAVLGATAENSALNGSYAVTVSQLAKAATYSFADRFSSENSIINSSINNGATSADRTVTVQVGTGSNQESVNVELTNSTTAQEFVTAFNTASNKAEASLVNVGTSSAPSYAIVIQSTDQGLDNGQIAVSVGNEIETAGSGAFIEGSATLSQATNSQFTVSGINGTISRSSNSVSDVVAGVTFSFLSTGSATVNVTDDRDTTKQTVKDFVDAYNEVISYVSENDLVTRTQEAGKDPQNIFAPLAGTSVDESLVSALRSALTGAGTTGRTVNILADLGITTERDGSLKFDESKFDTAVSNDSEGTRTVLENLGEGLAAVDGTIAQYTRFNGIIGQAESGNNTQISTLQSRISDLEDALLKQQDNLTGQFARLESLIGKLNSQQSALSGLSAR